MDANYTWAVKARLVQDFKLSGGGWKASSGSIPFNKEMEITIYDFLYILDNLLFIVSVL